MTQIVQALHMADYGMERWNLLVGGPSSRLMSITKRDTYNERLTIAVLQLSC